MAGITQLVPFDTVQTVMCGLSVKQRTKRSEESTEWDKIGLDCAAWAPDPHGALTWGYLHPIKAEGSRTKGW
eukprot:7382963-Prymnesium_polylepis.1